MRPRSKQLILLDTTSGIDPDVLAFIQAASITNMVIVYALNNFVLGLKNYNIWQKMYAVYPLVGGSASTHKFNLKNPQDTNAAYRLTFSGGLTHNSNGITFGGVNGTISTNMASTVPAQNSVSFGVYSRTSGNGAGAEFALGSGTASPRLNMLIQYTNGNTYFDLNNTYLSTIVALATTATGLYVSSRTASNAINLYRRGVNVSSQTDASSAIMAGTIGMGAFSGGGYSSRNVSYYHISQGLTNTEVSQLNELVQNLQIALSRNAY